MGLESQEKRAAHYGIEQAAASQHLRPDVSLTPMELHHSQCISAKRQADALERIEGHLRNLAGELAHPEYGVAPTIRSAVRDLGR